MKFSYLLFIVTIIGCSLCCSNMNNAGANTRDFEFVSGNKKLSGIIDQPANGKSKALIILVHGSGGTDIRGEGNYAGLRKHFTELGITCVTWDKPGMGKSEGTFDANQPLEESAQEVLDAVLYLKKEKIPGFSKIGIWSTSSGCWVAPLVMSKNPGIQFWISVSGVPAEDNKYYLIESNLPLEGHTAEETKVLMDELKRGRQLMMQGGSYDDYLAATQHLRKDRSIFYFAGDVTGTKESYEAEQRSYMATKDNYEFDENFSLIRVRHFSQLLKKLNIDMLALFGEKDTNVNWRNALALYDSTVKQNPDASFTVRVFPNANHNLNITKTGSVREVEGTPIGTGVLVKDYYETQVEWLRKYVLN